MIFLTAYSLLSKERIKKMKDSIKISPAHGLNPGMISCFWCGEPMGFALYGKISTPDNKDAKAPHMMSISLDPCDKCMENFKKGITAVCVQEMTVFMNENNAESVPDFLQITLDNEKYVVTGACSVIKKDAQVLHKLFPDKEAYEQVIKRGIFYMSKNMYDQMLDSAEKCMQEED